MQLKHIFPVGILYILCTSVGAIAQPTGLPSKDFKSPQPPPKKVLIQTAPQKDYFPKPAYGNPKPDQLIEQLKKSSEKMIRSGGVDTGGGTIVRTNQGIGLLDLYLHNKELFTDKKPSQENYDSRPIKKLGVDLFTNSQQPIMKKTLAQISKWDESSPSLTRYLKLALKNLRIYIHEGSFRTGPIEYYLPEYSEINSSDLRMIAIYIKGFGVHVGLDDFKRLPETHQIGLLIHESLRAMSIAGDFNYSNETIQKLTAAIMSSPTSGESLDSNLYLNGKVLESRIEFVDLIKKVQTLKVKVCASEYSLDNNSCELQESDTTLDGARRIANNIFTKLYSAPKNPAKDQLLAEAYNLVTRFENSAFQDLLSEAKLLTLPQNHLTMLIDSYIDFENTHWLPTRDAVAVKNSLKTYFHTIGVDIK